MERYRKPRFCRSLNQAWQGLLHTCKTQRHMKVHLVAGISVVCNAWMWQVSGLEWIILIFAIGCVIGAEVFNSAIEIVVDLVQPNFHPLAGLAKDVAAGAVLVSTFQAIVIGMIVFLPRLIGFASKLF